MFEHYALVVISHPGRPVHPVAIYLRPGEEGRRPLDRLVLRADGRRISYFRFTMIALWEIPAAEILDLDAPALWAIVALAGGTTHDHVKRARDQILRQVDDASIRTELFGILYAVSGTRFTRDSLRNLIPMEIVMESSTYQAILEEGIEKGIEKGIATGSIQALRGACATVVRARMRMVPPELDAILARNPGLDDLERLLGELAASPDAAAILRVLEAAI